MIVCIEFGWSSGRAFWPNVLVFLFLFPIAHWCTHLNMIKQHCCASGLTSCQLQRQRALLSQDTDLVPQCMESGEYQPVQCDGALGQCWCVDLEGMEIYGTRQNGRPLQCEWIVNSVTVHLYATASHKPNWKETTGCICRQWYIGIIMYLFLKYVHMFTSLFVLGF